MKYGRKIPMRDALRVACSLGAIATMLAFGGCVKSESPGADSTASDSSTAVSAACPSDNGDITLPAGFCATVFADSIGHADLWLLLRRCVRQHRAVSNYISPRPRRFQVACATHRDVKPTIIALRDPTRRTENVCGTRHRDVQRIALYQKRATPFQADRQVRAQPCMLHRHGSIASQQSSRGGHTMPLSLSGIRRSFIIRLRHDPAIKSGRPSRGRAPCAGLAPGGQLSLMRHQTTSLLRRRCATQTES